MAGSSQESCQWLSVTEETLFLHDGLMRVTDLVELPRDVNNTQDSENEVISFDLKNPADLSDLLLAVCGTHNNAYAKLLEYRLNALRGFWNAQRQLSSDEESEKESSCTEETIALLKKQGLWKEPEQATFSTRVSVLLVIPLLQSQSRIDPNLCGVTSSMLLGCLKDCAPLSLSKEPGDCLKGLENLLCSWLGEHNELENSHIVQDIHQRKTIASALVALACARGHLKTFIHTVHLLLTLRDIDALPVADILTKLLETEGGPGHVPALSGSKHILCWGFEDLLSATEKESGEKEKAEGEIGRSLATCGVYMYTTNGSGKGLAKVGSGLHGTLRGYVYAKNQDIGPGKVAFGAKCLLYRPQAFDAETETQNFFQILDSHTLQPLKTIPKPESYLSPGPCTTIAFCSDGTLFYWVWCPVLLADKTAKGIPVYVDTFQFKEGEDVLPLKPRLTLIKKDDSGAKSLNESLMSRLRPMYRGSATALAALAGAENGIPKKEETATQSGSTTCGIVLKVLAKTPLFIEGSHVVMLTSLPGGNASNAARSLFGSSGGLSSLRSLATNQCFSLSDGQFIQRPDLMDAPSCAIARGAPIASLGMCFDVTNNVIWTCGSDWMDQFYNPGHQAPHHIRARLCIQDSPSTLTENNTVTLTDVIRKILQHVGSMCLHQIHSDLLYTPFGSYTIQQYPVDYVNLERICDILSSSVSTGHNETIICALIVLQLIFKMSVIKPQKSGEEVLVEKTRCLVWQLVTTEEQHINTNAHHVQREACMVIASGLMAMYPTSEKRAELMRSLLDGGDHPGLSCLRDKILCDLTDQLKGQVTKLEQFLNISFPEDLTSLLLKMAVKESCNVLHEAVSVGKEGLEEMLTVIPLSSPCLRYLMALQSYLLREAVLFTVSEDDKANVEIEKAKLENLQNMVQNFAEKVFSGACQVLEMLLNCCNKLIQKNAEHLETYLQSLEKVAKATILGHMLPCLRTAMTHSNLHCLGLADTLMPQLVQLVILSSQTALLLKSQVQAETRLEEEPDKVTDVMDIIGEPQEKDDIADQEGEEFLAGLKIPALWSSGKREYTPGPR